MNRLCVNLSSLSTLKRELGLRDLTLFAASCIVSTRWIVAAAQAGAGSVSLWLASAIFFVVPLAIAVAALSVRYPGAGGLYRWTREDFGAWHGFLCFWVYWMGIACWFPGAALYYMTAALHALGAAESRILVVLVSLSALWVALGTNLVGIRIGKWTENIGAAAAWGLAFLLAGVAAADYYRRGSATPLSILPGASWDTLSLWGSIAYAMSGLELAALMGAEIRDPERTLPRAGWIASGFATCFYSVSTTALLILVPSAKLDALSGLSQGADAAGRILSATWLSFLIAVLALLSAVGQFGGIGAAVSRLPYAAGCDGLMPEAFAKVHPRWGTPYLSMLFLGAVASGLLVLMQLGDTLRAAYQAIVSLMLIAGFLPYLYIFASAWRAGKRWSAASGGGVTCLALMCAVVPTAEVRNVWTFEVKLLIGTAAVIGSGRIMYQRVVRRDGHRPKPHAVQD